MTDFDGSIDYRLEHLPQKTLQQMEMRPGVGRSFDTYPPVVALTLTKLSGGIRVVLVCVRDAIANRTHPNVLSSPTRRVVHADFHQLREALAADPANSPQALTILTPTIHDLLTTKLQVPTDKLAQLKLGRVAAWQGASVIGTSAERPIVEHLTMINVHCSWPTAESEIPPVTSEYSDIRWLDWNTHAALVNQRDISMLKSLYSERPPLVYGLCTRSTRSMLDALDREGHLSPGSRYAFTSQLALSLVGS